MSAFATPVAVHVTAFPGPLQLGPVVLRNPVQEPLFAPAHTAFCRVPGFRAVNPEHEE